MEYEGNYPVSNADGKVIGIDLGITDFAITYDGEKTSKYPNSKHLAKYEKKLAKKQRIAGKRYYLSTGFTDSVANRKVAEMKARQIELDILSGNFDPTLAKYKPESLQAKVTPSITPIAPASLVDLWESYIEFKRSSLSPSTLAKDVKRITRCIDLDLPVKSVADAIAIRDWLIANKTPNSCKRILTQISGLGELLKSIKPVAVEDEEKVFPSKEDKWIDIHNFTNRGWKTTLEKLDGIEYRKLYQTRHTFITLALRNGMDVKDVAKLVGNSPEVIYRHYVGHSREIVVPDF